MKKKWIALSLIVLITQTLMPLVTLAEVIQSNEKTSSIELKTLVLENDVVDNPDEVNMTLTVSSNTLVGEDNLVDLEGFTVKSSEKESIMNEKEEVIGWVKKDESSLVIHTENETNGVFQIHLTGKLTDNKQPSQVISVSHQTQKLTQKVNLVAIENSDSSSDVNTEKVTESEESSMEQKEVTREPKNIEELLKGEAFFKDVVMQKEDLKNGDFITIDGEKTPMTLGEKIKVNMNYALPENVRSEMKSGDFYQAQLPSEIAIYTPVSGELVSSEGVVYGDYKIDTHGEIVIIFNENVENHHEVGGYFFVESLLQQGNMKEYGDNRIKFPFVENSPEVNLFIQNETKEEMAKTGSLNRKNNPTHIDWHVDINMNYGIHNKAVVTEEFPKGTSFESIEIKELLVGLDGSVSEGAVVPSTEYDVSANGSKISFHNKINKPYRLSYKTKIEDSSKPGEEGGVISYHNEAKMTSAELTSENTAQADIEAQYKKMLNKKQINYNPDGQVITWQIEYNHIESSIKRDQANLRDTFEGKMTLDKNSLEIYKVAFDANGSQVSQGDLLTEGSDYQLISNGNGFDIQFLHDIDYATTITYKTLIDEEIHESDGSSTYGNTVKDGNGNKSSDSVNAYQRVLAKWYSDINYRDKTVDWHIRVNTNKYEMNNFVLTDKMSTGLGIPKTPKTIEIRDYTAGNTLIEGQDYKFKYVEGSKEFELSFIGQYAQTSHVFEISYETVFDTPELHEAGETHFSNNVEATWGTKEGKIVTNKSNSSFEPRPEDQSDGFKHGNYNAKTKEIDWQLGINYNKKQLGDVVIRDELKSNQVYVPGSLKMYHYSITESGEVVPGKRLTDDELADLVTIIEPSIKKELFAPIDPLDKNELLVKIKDVGIENQYLMTFKTSLVGQIVHKSTDYHNTALVQAQGVGTDEFKIEGDVSIANGDSFVEKSGHQDNEGFLQWKVTINPSQSTIYNPVVTDNPSSNQAIVKESIQLYELDTDERGNLKRGSLVEDSAYHVSLETNEATYEQGLKITFAENKINKAYLLEYKSSLFLEKSSGEFATNQVKLSGNNEEIVSQEKSKDISVRMSSGGGTASGKEGKLFIQKQSEEYGEGVSQPLSGTVFEIFDKQGVQSLGTAQTGDDGQAVFEKLPLGNYVLKEIQASEGYRISKELEEGIPVEVTRMTSTGLDKLTLTNEKNVEKVTISAKKEWEDENNQDGIRPDNVEVQLYRDNQKVGNPEKLCEENKWFHEWKNLDKTDKGQIVDYRVEEISEVSGYTLSEKENDKAGNFRFTNKHVPEKITVSGVKTWDDQDNQDGVRPTEIVVNVLKNGQEYVSKKVKPDDNENWVYKFEYLPKYDKGTEIKYSVSENDVVGYTPNVTGYDIKNTHTPGKTSLFVSKAWEDENDQDGKRAKSVFVQLYGEDKKQGEPIELNDGNNWQHQWTELDEKVQGKVIKYSVREITETKGYTATLNDKNPGNVIITNTHTPETITISGNKTWNDKDNQDGIRSSEIVVNVLRNGQEYLSKKVKPDTEGNWHYEFKELPKYGKGTEFDYSITENDVPGYTPKVTGYDIENTYTPGKTSFSVSKNWDDENDQDGKRAKSVFVQLYGGNQKHGEPIELNKENNWQYQWSDLDEKSTGETIEYSVKEVTKVPGYITTVNDANPRHTIITNTHTPEVITVSGNKVWNDKNDQDGVRPSDIVINILQDGQEYLSKKVKPDTEGNWYYEFKELPKYGKGREINYTITENDVPGYTPKMTGYDVENTYTPGKTSFFVSKSWNDENDQDGKRSSSVFVQLYGNDKQQGEPIELNQGNNWQYQWTDLDEKNKGELIKYEVKEITEVSGYTTVINDKIPGNALIMNTHEPEITTITGVKTWNDNNNQDGIRPQSIVVNVLQGGQEYVAKKVKPDNKGNWNYEFKDLPKYNQGELIDYSVTENSVENYTPTVTGYNIENTHTPGKTSFFVSKAWNDENNQDGKRSSSVSVQLYGDNKKQGDIVTLHPGNHWQHQWVELDEKNDGKLIKYEVKEITDLPGYTTTINTENPGNVIITNTHIPELTAVSGHKTWQDNNNQDGVRPEDIVVNILQDGQEFLSKKVSSDKKGNWDYEFKNLPKYNKGTEINYSVTEDNVPGYTPKITGYDIENTHTPGKTTFFVSKAWNDENNQDGKRPDFVSVQLYANDKLQGEVVELNEGNNWQYQWSELDEKKQGKEVKYSVKEVTNVPGYTTIINEKNPGNAIISNTHTPERTSISGSKTWQDKDNQDGIRPESISVNLLSNGYLYESIEVKSDDKGNWKYAFEGLPKYSGGEEIVYTITENTVENYTTTVDGFNLNNSYTPGKTNVMVSKAWNDDNNQDGKRPEFISVQLYANGKKQGKSIQLNESNQWQYNWEDLDEKAKQQVIEYTVKEEQAEGYVATIDDHNKGNILITNTHVSEVIDISGVKVWDDNHDKEGKRPEEITINLLKNGQLYTTKKVKGSSESEWKYEFLDVPKYELGKEINYTITENQVADYSSKISGNDIKNTYTPGKTNATVTKTWNDNQDKAEKRPKAIQVQLYQNGIKKGEPVKLSNKNNWTATWNDLSIEEKGKEISYEVKEVTHLDDYKADVNNQDIGNIIITNTYVGHSKTSEGHNNNKDNRGQSNKSTATKLPQSGESHIIWPIISGICLIGGIGYIYSKKRRA